MKSLSLQSRLLLTALLILLGFAMLTGLALDRAFRESAETALQDRLRGYMFALLAATEVSDRGELSFSRDLPEASFRQPGSGLYAEVQHAGEPDRRLASRSLLGIGLPQTERPPTGQGIFRQLTTRNDETLYAYIYGARWQTDQHLYPLTYRVAANMDSYHAQIRDYRRNLWGWLALATLLLLVAQALVLRWGLRPLRRVEQDLDAIKHGHREQLREDYPRELQGLTRNLNLLLGTTRQQLIRYRDALGNASHSLKTPLSVLRGLLRPGVLDDTASRQADEQLDRMQQIIDYHLQRAATAGPLQPAKPVAIRPVVQRLINSLHKSRQDKPVEVELALDESTLFYGDEGDLYELLGNLLDNAFKWCWQRIRVSADYRAPRQLVLQVEDDGPGIPEAVRERVIERGQRADPHVEGHGLGLAMVQEIVMLYGGRLQIDLGRQLHGAAITLTFPLPTG